jgi:hypothetical protein
VVKNSLIGVLRHISRGDGAISFNATVGDTDVPLVRQRKLQKWARLSLDEAPTFLHPSDGWPAFAVSFRSCSVAPGRTSPSNRLSRWVRA